MGIEVGIIELSILPVAQHNKFRPREIKRRAPHPCLKHSRFTALQDAISSAYPSVSAIHSLVWQVAGLELVVKFPRHAP